MKNNHMNTKSVFESSDQDLICELVKRGKNKGNQVLVLNQDDDGIIRSHCTNDILCFGVVNWWMTKVKEDWSRYE